jgi:beta-lactamase regulating signal transducer with metallopeptidase domain/protocatechuate 3,4-dioxygenase beta subunit
MPSFHEWVGPVFSSVLRASWQSSVLIVLVLFTQFLLRRVLSAQWRYALWSLVLARLILPFSFESAVSVFNVLPPRVPEAAAKLYAPATSRWSQDDAILRSRVAPSPNASMSQMAGESFTRAAERTSFVQDVKKLTFADLESVFQVVWFLGIVLLGSRVVWISCRFSARVRGKPLTDLRALRLARECKEAVGLRNAPILFESPEVRSPLVFGILVPNLLLPPGIVEKFTPEQLRYVILHEFCHVRRRDIVLNWFITCLQILHWFNPLVWLAFRRLRSDREPACDAMVLSSFSGARPVDYGKTIIRLLEGFTRPERAPGLAGILEDRRQMKRRLMMISDFGKNSRRWVWAAAAVFALIAALGLTDARTQGRTQMEASERLLAVRVIDASTRSSISGATINGTYLADDSGSFHIPVPSIPAMIVARADGYVSRFVQFWNSSIVPQEYVFVLERGETIGGVVHDQSGMPIANVEVHVTGRNRPLEHEGTYFNFVAMTDAQGRWRCSEFPADADGLTLTVVHSEHAAAYHSWGTAASRMYPQMADYVSTMSLDALKEQNAVFTLKPGLQIGGSILDASGRPIEGASVAVRPLSLPTAGRSKAVTGADGTFVFNNGAPGTWEIILHARGYQSQLKTIKVSPGMPENTFYLAKGAILRGRVVDESGNPVAGATIGSVVSDLGSAITTDAEGWFEWDSAPDKPLSVQIRAPGFVAANQILEAGGRNEVRLRRFRRIQVTGQVVDASTGKPIPQFRVSISTTRIGVEALVDYRSAGVSATTSLGTWANYRPAVTGTNGFFSLALEDSFPPSGTIVQSDGSRDSVVRYAAVLKIEADGYYPETSQYVAIENGDADLSFALQPGSGISGIVVLPNGAPARGAKVILGATERPGVVLMEVSGHFSDNTLDSSNLRAQTDSSGTFSFPPVQRPIFIAVAHQDGFAVFPLERVSGPPAIRLEPWGRIEGTLRVGSRPGSNEIIQLWGTASNAVQVQMNTRTDERGRFVFDRVPPGILRVVHTTSLAQRRGVFSNFPLQQQSVESHAGRTEVVHFGGSGRPLIGRIILAGSAQGQFTGPGRLETTTPQMGLGFRSYFIDFDGDGVFRIEDVAVGSYQLTIPVGGTPFTRQIVVPEIAGGRSDDPLDLGDIVIRK